MNRYTVEAYLLDAQMAHALVLQLKEQKRAILRKGKRAEKNNDRQMLEEALQASREINAKIENAADWMYKNTKSIK